MMTQIAKDDEYAQMFYKKGIKRHGDPAVEAMLQEWSQLGESDKKMLIPMLVSKLTKGDKRKALGCCLS